MEDLDALVKEQIVFQMILVNIVENQESRAGRGFQNECTKSPAAL